MKEENEKEGASEEAEDINSHSASTACLVSRVPGPNLACFHPCTAPTPARRQSPVSEAECGASENRRQKGGWSWAPDVTGPVMTL